MLFPATLLPTGISEEVTGTVVWEKPDCDHYIIETDRYYVLAERYTGRLYNGDNVQGELYGTGFKLLKNLSGQDSEVKVYLENYWTSKQACLDWLKENRKCGL